MFFFTENERRTIVIVCAVFLLGTTVRYVCRVHPEVFDLVNVIETERLYPKIDINTASYEALLALPYIGPATANAIIDYREKHDGFTSIDQVQHLYAVRPSNFDQFKHYLHIP